MLCQHYSTDNRMSEILGKLTQTEWSNSQTFQSQRQPTILNVLQNSYNFWIAL